MYKSISDKSSQTLLSELNLFAIPDTSVGVVSSRYIECPLTHAIPATGGIPGPVEFRYSLQPGFLNLQKSYILFTIGIRDAAGKVIEVKENEELPLAFTQMIAKTLFKQWQLYLNGSLIEDTSPLYAWRSIIETELRHDKLAKETTLSLGGYAYDEDIGKSTSSGHVRRKGWLNKKGEGQFAATLNLNMFNQNRLLLNYVDLKLVGFLNDPKMVIDSFELDSDANQYTYEILDMKLMLHEFTLHDTTSNAIEGLLKQNKMITYPLTNVQMRAFHIAGGRFDSPECRLLTSALPKKIVMAMVDSDAFIGKHTKPSFNFKPFNIKDAFLNCGGRMIPARPLNLNFGEDQYMPAYINLLEGTGVARNSKSNGITRENFKNGYSFFVFEVSPSNDSGTFDLINLGTTSFNISFREAVPENGVYCILHCEYDSMLTIDENRVAHVDAIM